MKTLETLLSTHLKQFFNVVLALSTHKPFGSKVKNWHNLSPSFKGVINPAVRELQL